METINNRLRLIDNEIERRRQDRLIDKIKAMSDNELITFREGTLNIINKTWEKERKGLFN
jgi:hypothetical protein